MLLAVVGCDQWPLYLHLPVDVWTPPVATELSAAEEPGRDPSLPIEGGELVPPCHVQTTGAIEVCGFDAHVDGPAWPVHPIDSDGDGVPESTGSRYAGWYNEELDLWTWVAAADGWLSAELGWENSPSSGTNAPFRPNEPEGDWTMESDLDLIVARVEGEELVLIDDSGFSSTHPESTTQLLAVAEGTTIALLVAYHHAVGSACSLSIRLDVP